MALIIYPRDLLAGFPGIASLQLGYVQELQPDRGGVQHSADLGDPLWELTAESRLLKPSELRLWKARLASMEDGAKTFLGYDLTACFPLAYPRGSWPTGLAFSGVAGLHAVNAANYKELQLRSLPAGFVVSEGDYLSVAIGARQVLLQAMAEVAADGFGVTPMLEVRPWLFAGAALDAAIAAHAPVALIKPHAVMAIIPGSVAAPVQNNAWGSISFSARQTSA